MVCHRVPAKAGNGRNGVCGGEGTITSLRDDCIHRRAVGRLGIVISMY